MKQNHLPQKEEDIKYLQCLILEEEKKVSTGYCQQKLISIFCWNKKLDRFKALFLDQKKG